MDYGLKQGCNGAYTIEVATGNSMPSCLAFVIICSIVGQRNANLNKVVWRTTYLYSKGVIIVNSLFVRCRQHHGGVNRYVREEPVCPHVALQQHISVWLHWAKVTMLSVVLVSIIIMVSQWQCAYCVSPILPGTTGSNLK